MSEKIPAEDRRSQADARIGSSADRFFIRHTLIDESLNVRGGSISLPERHDVCGVLELAAEDAGVNRGRQHLARFNAEGEKVVTRTVSADAVAVVHKRAILPAFVFANLSYWGIIFGSGGLGRCGHSRAHGRQ